MTERPILMKDHEVRATLASTMTQMRRAIEPQPEWVNENAGSWIAIGEGGMAGPRSDWLHWRGERVVPNDPRCPYGQPGERLWGRETWAQLGDGDIARKATWPDAAHLDDPEPKWRPSAHMPRWASRITLEVTGVRVERLQDISEADAIAEGIERGAGFPGWYRGPLAGDSASLQQAGRDFKIPTAFPHLAYRALWESIHGPDSWDANPFVWVVEFRRVTP
jgi:hypothetical protein